MEGYLAWIGLRSDVVIVVLVVHCSISSIVVVALIRALSLAVVVVVLVVSLIELRKKYF